MWFRSIMGREPWGNSRFDLQSAELNHARNLLMASSDHSVALFEHKRSGWPGLLGKALHVNAGFSDECEAVGPYRIGSAV